MSNFYRVLGLSLLVLGVSGVTASIVQAGEPLVHYRLRGTCFSITRYTNGTSDLDAQMTACQTAASNFKDRSIGRVEMEVNCTYHAPGETSCNSEAVVLNIYVSAD